jgi:hypothetical protein
MEGEYSLFDQCWEQKCNCNGTFIDNMDGEFLCDKCGMDQAFMIEKDTKTTCSCGGLFIHEESEIVCDTCGMISELGLDEHIQYVQKIRGYVYTQEQYKSLLKSMLAMNDVAKQNNIRPFSKELLEDSVNFFFTLREHISETRSQQLKAMFVSCIQRMCTLQGQMRDLRDIKNFCGINKTNLTPSLCLLQQLETKGIISKIEVDKRSAYSNSICIDCGLSDPLLIEKICKLVVHILDVSSSENISSNSTFNSKVISATYISMKIYKVDITAEKICTKRKIHIDTINHFVTQVKIHNKKVNFEEYLRLSGGR